MYMQQNCYYYFIEDIYSLHLKYILPLPSFSFLFLHLHINSDFNSNTWLDIRNDITSSLALSIFLHTFIGIYLAIVKLLDKFAIIIII